MSFFKAYDMRGTYPIDFDLDTIEKVGRVLPAVVGGRRYLVGRDTRLTSPAVHEALLKGLLAAGAEVTDLGLCTTPMVYFYTGEGDFDGSIMITASHNPPTDNGLKVSKKTALPVGYKDGLDKVEALVAISDKRKVISGGRVTSFDGLKHYKEWLIQHSTLNTQTSTLKYAVDCSNGMAALLAKDLFPGAIIINDTLDGSFPAHSPNPLKAEAREQIAALVREKQLDLGLIFDGDADRCMFVDENGDFVQPDYLIPIIAGAICDGNGEKVIHDVRTSRGAIDRLKEMGFEPHMVPVGHAFAKPILREIGAVGGGELAGHYYFKDFYGCDSGVLAALKVLEEVSAAKKGGKTFSEMMAPITKKFANSGEINFKVENKDEVMAKMLEKAQAFAPVIGKETMDGVRLEFEEGWVNVRKSNTEPYLRLIVEHKDASTLEKWVRSLEGIVK